MKDTKKMRKIIKIDEDLCDGCGLCVPDCAEGSLKIIDGKARLVADKLCDGLGACLGSCPTGALQIIEREADEFDEEAVDEYLKNEGLKSHAAPAKTGGCPSAQIHTFAAPIQSFAPTTATAAESNSALTHWPVQIRLVPPTAPFLQGADLLIAADCATVAAANFQGDYLKGKKVLMGCPKFDDAELYVGKIAAIITEAHLKSLTILIMEVPCCSAMNVIIDQAVKKSGVQVPVEQITISRQGLELERKKW